jgi:glutaredoxin
MKQPDLMPAARVRLFIKPYCGWCRQAMAWLDRQGVVYETLDVTRDAKAWDEMVVLSGQTFAPVIEVGGKVLADFGAAELAPWWESTVAARRLDRSHR